MEFKTSEPTQRIAAADLEKLALMAPLLVASWVLPPAKWTSFCLKIASLRPAFLSRRRQREVSRIPRFLVELSGGSPQAFAEQGLALFYEEVMQVMRLYRPGPAWEPKIEFAGLEHLVEARKDGRGPILWIGFAYSLVAKMALARQGLPMNQLSRPIHGYSSSLFGIRFLNPIRQKIENRFLKRRIVIRGDSAAGAMREMTDLLKAGDMVTITYGGQANQVIETPFMGGYLTVPTGPLNLSRMTRADLLPVFTLQLSPDSYRVEILPAITAATDSARTEALSEGAAQYATVLDRYVRLYPHLWTEWKQVWHPAPAATLTETK